MQTRKEGMEGRKSWLGITAGELVVSAGTEREGKYLRGHSRWLLKASLLWQKEETSRSLPGFRKRDKEPCF